MPGSLDHVTRKRIVYTRQTKRGASAAVTD
jgi:hypothetical protein